MKALNSFNNSTSDFKLEADATRDKQTLKLVYKIADVKNLLNLPAGFVAEESTTPRVDGLWNNTCFEMFLRPVGKTSYYEFNFSLMPAWNEYFFESYLKPHTPQQCQDISLKSMKWNVLVLEVELQGLNPDDKFEISLTAVLKEKSGTIHYMATKHAGHEPDFHHVDSFIPL